MRALPARRRESKRRLRRVLLGLAKGPRCARPGKPSAGRRSQREAPAFCAGHNATQHNAARCCRCPPLSLAGGPRGRYKQQSTPPSSVALGHMLSSPDPRRAPVEN
eukprot:scaffold31_cov312-Prasinococcus_capsulatus_cf.AAC.10